MKRDQYKECSDQNIPVEDFRLQFCSRCVQPECTRSQHGKSKFDQRVTTWESRLFVDVPRMALTDPRFQSFQAKKFSEIDTGRVPEVQGWVDPRDLEPETPMEAVEPVSEPQEPEPDKVEKAAPSSQEPAMGQTPNRRGQMLGGKKTPAKKPSEKSDPWAPKKTPEGKVVKPGAKIRLGNS